MRPQRTDDPAAPYTRGDVATMTGSSAPQVKKVTTAVLQKPGAGMGIFTAYSLDDAVRVAVSRELVRVGVTLAGVREIFAAIETPAAKAAKPWTWLRTLEARRDGAALVLLRHPLAPAHAHGAVYLTTRAQAIAWLEQKAMTVTVIDVGALIERIELHSGTPYTTE